MVTTLVVVVITSDTHAIAQPLYVQVTIYVHPVLGVIAAVVAPLLHT